jgi:hypothetical protein
MNRPARSVEIGDSFFCCKVKETRSENSTTKDTKCSEGFRWYIAVRTAPMWVGFGYVVVMEVKYAEHDW